MKFVSLTYRNFLSCGNNPITIDMDTNHLSLIVGKNGNGKSTFIDAICFALYGKSFREINKGNLVNSLNKKECLVEVVFQKGGNEYKVYRGIKPNIFEIYKDDEKIHEESSITVQQSYLQDIIGIDFEAFRQIVVLGNSNYVPFMKMKTSERRKFIEDILDMQIFSKMLEIAKTDYKETQKKYQDIESDIKQLRLKISMKTDNLKILKEKSSHDISKYDVLIQESLTKINGLKEDLSKINVKSYNEKFKTFSDKLTQINTTSNVLRHKSSEINKDLNFLNNNDTCPTCEQTIDEKFKETKISDISKKKVEITDKENNLSQGKVKLQDGIEKVSEYISRANSIRNKLENEISIVKSYQNQKKSFIKDQKNFVDFDSEESAILEMNEEYLNLDHDIKEVEKEIDRYRNIITFLGDKGLKQEIVKQYIPIINENVNKYLMDMNFYVDFHIDKNFKETIKARKRDESSYNACSEGERKRIDIALIFTWRDVMNMIHVADKINLLVLDEILDGSLDSEGIEDFMEILMNMENSNIFIISHRKDASLEHFNRVITFEKNDGFSEMKVDMS